MRVAVLGSGVAGLATAIAMQRRAGNEVTVFERSTREELAARPGHGLILMQNGRLALGQLGADGFLAQHRALHRAVIQDQAGAILRSEPMDGTYCVTRKAVIEALTAQLTDTPIHYGHGCTGLDLDPWPADPARGHRGRRLRSVTFRNGSRLSDADVDLFVAADGSHSMLHAAINTDQSRPCSPVLEIVTSTRLPDLAERLGSTFLKTLFPGQGLAFGLLSPSEDVVIGFLQFDSRRYSPEAIGHDLGGFVRGVVSHAPEPVTDYLRRADYSTGHLWRPLNAPIPAALSVGNAVLVGDAAHPLLPFTSQGVGAALEDAIMLADATDHARTRPFLLSHALDGFARDRTADLAAFVVGGQKILSHFIGSSNASVLPYVDGTTSKLSQHLALPAANVITLCQLFDQDGDGALTRTELQRATSAILGRSLQAAEQDAIFAHSGANRDDRITLEEFVWALGDQGADLPALNQMRTTLTPRTISALILAHTPKTSSTSADQTGHSRHEHHTRGASPTVTSPARTMSPHESGELFADRAVNLPVLRQRAYNHRWAVQPDNVIPLTAADSDFPVSDDILEAMKRHLDSGYIPYGPPEGLPQLRRVAADTLRARHRLTCDPETLFPTDGAASAVFLATRFAIAVEGDEAIIPDPVDFLLDRSVKAAGGVVKRWRVSNGHYDIDQLKALITPRTTLISLSNPHNPLGRVLRRQELEGIAQVALQHNLWILSDEVWSDIVYQPHQHVSMASLGADVAARTLTVFGFSKSYSLAGLRLGLLSTPTTSLRNEVLHLAHAHDTAYGVSTLSQIAGAAAYQLGDAWLASFVGHLRRQRDHAVQRLNAIPHVSCVTPEGTFVAFPHISDLNIDQDELAGHLLQRHRLAVIPGSPHFFGPAAADHIRLSFATSRTILDQGLTRLEEGLKDLPQTPRTTHGRTFDGNRAKDRV